MNIIAELNDQFRRGDCSLGKYAMTSGVNTLPHDKQVQLIRLVQQFNTFTAENDPYQEHDFGKIVFEGDNYFWKINYYDPTLTRHSCDPASPNATRRILMLMRSEEY